MNGAEALVRTLLASGVDTCFANPGTSEMHLMAALDRVAGMRCVLGMFEGVATGAADGYARMAGRPAATLLHLGPGLANGLANLHNARKAHSPVVNIVGEHAMRHRGYDAPLSADVAAFAAPVSHWVRLTERTADLSRDAALAVAESKRGSGRIASLIVPADVAWSDGAEMAESVTPPRPVSLGSATIREAAEMLSRPGAALIVGGASLRGEALKRAARIAAKTGARLIAGGNAARAERGAGRPVVERIPYRVAQAVEHLKEVTAAVLCGCAAPVAFFAYPGQPSELLPAGTPTLAAGGAETDATQVLAALEQDLGAGRAAWVAQAKGPVENFAGPLTLQAIAAALRIWMPDQAVLDDESIAAGFVLVPLLAGAPQHDHLQLTGGSIGMGLPLATGAAIAAPDRKVICLEGDGSAMYTLQALWTQAREGTDVTTIILANRAYATLRMELANVGVAQPGATALSMLDLSQPELDWVTLAGGMGVEAARATSAEQFGHLLASAMRRRGPFLIEAVLP